MSLIECHECGKEISDKAEVCPNCGISFGAPSWIKSISWILAIFLFFIIAGSLYIASIGYSISTLTTSEQEPTNKKSEVLIPALQEKFIAIAARHRNKYQKTTNQLVKDSIDDVRLDTLKKLVESKPISNWVGEITHIDSTVLDEVILSVSIGEHLVLSTSFNTLLFASYDTLIKDKSNLKNTLQNLEIGDKIQFSGSFPSLVDDQLVDGGNATNPILLFKFSEIEPLN